MGIGEDRVRINFNPSANPDVEKLKQLAADFINACERHRHNSTSGEVNRLWALAQTHAEDAAMWAVKAVTAPAT